MLPEGTLGGIRGTEWMYGHGCPCGGRTREVGLAAGRGWVRAFPARWLPGHSRLQVARDAIALTAPSCSAPKGILASSRRSFPTTTLLRPFALCRRAGCGCLGRQAPVGHLPGNRPRDPAPSVQSRPPGGRSSEHVRVRETPRGNVNGAGGAPAEVKSAHSSLCARDHPRFAKSRLHAEVSQWIPSGVALRDAALQPSRSRWSFWATRSSSSGLSTTLRSTHLRGPSCPSPPPGRAAGWRSRWAAQGPDSRRPSVPCC